MDISCEHLARGFETKDHELELGLHREDVRC